jgi:hypothetical protein
MDEQTFVLEICSLLDDEWNMRRALEKKLPSLKWEEGDSSWGKVRVWGKNAQFHVRIYRYEPPGTFRLTIAIGQGVENVEQAYKDLRDAVLQALDGSICEAPEPQPAPDAERLTAREIAPGRKRLAEAIGED